VCRGVIAAILAGTCVSASAATHTVAIEGMRFNPDGLTVERGDTVIWVNKDLVAHTVASVPAFNSNEIVPGASWSYVVRDPGNYAYGCTLHPTMKATLTVKDQ
jgi:plastocyanin